MQKNVATLKGKLAKLEKDHKELQAEFEQYKRESLKWSIEDLLWRAEYMGYALTKDQAQEALERMIEKHDPELGVTWITVDYFVEEYGEKA